MQVPVLARPAHASARASPPTTTTRHSACNPRPRSLGARRHLDVSPMMRTRFLTYLLSAAPAAGLPTAGKPLGENLVGSEVGAARIRIPSRHAPPGEPALLASRSQLHRPPQAGNRRSLVVLPSDKHAWCGQFSVRSRPLLPSPLLHPTSSSAAAAITTPPSQSPQDGASKADTERGGKVVCARTTNSHSGEGEGLVVVCRPAKVPEGVDPYNFEKVERAARFMKEPACPDDQTLALAAFSPILLPSTLPAAPHPHPSPSPSPSP